MCLENKDHLKRTMECVFVRTVWDGLWEWVGSLVQWGCHKALCQWLYERQGDPRIPIPEYDEETHPLQVFEDTHVEVNVYRWVVLVLWLQHCPKAWQWYRILQKTYPSRIPSIRTLSNELWHHVRRRRSR